MHKTKTSNDGAVRLQKLLSASGEASRRTAEEWIAAGRVKVNGRVAGLGDKADPRKDIVTVDGRRVGRPAAHRYIVLNKPRGVVTTLSDERGRPCVGDLLAGVGERVFPVGRLDRESEGLLLLTNDGAFANALMHPAGHVPKTYRVTVRPGLTEDQIAAFTQGLRLPDDPRPTLPAELTVLSRGPLSGGGERVVVQVVLYEGRNRQIRRMFEALGLEVARLKRVAVGPVKPGRILPGQWRELEEDEVQALRKACRRKEETHARHRGR